MKFLIDMVTNLEKEKIILNSLNPLMDILKSQDMNVSVQMNERHNLKSIDLIGKGDSTFTNGITFYLSYLATDAHKTKSDFMSITLSKLNELSIDFGKFLKENYPSLLLSKDNKLLVNEFKGNTFNEKAQACIDFLCSVLKSPLVSSYLKGEIWTNSYYKPWYEGTEF